MTNSPKAPCGDCGPQSVIDAATAAWPLAHGPVEIVPLSRVGAGRMAIVARADLDAQDLALLRAMGLRPQALLRVVRRGEPSLIDVFSGGPNCHCCNRIGLARALAEKVLVGIGPGVEAGA